MGFRKAFAMANVVVFTLGLVLILVPISTGTGGSGMLLAGLVLALASWAIGRFAPGILRSLGI